MLFQIDRFFYRIFGLDEIENDTALRIVYLFLIGNLGFFLFYFSEKVGFEVFQVYCHAYYPNCFPMQNLFFLNDHLYLRGFFYAFTLVTLTLACISYLNRFFGISHILIIVLALTTLIPSYLLTGEFNELMQHQSHYLFFVTLILLFVRRGRFEFLMFFYALVYLYTGVSKMISIDWLIGNFTLPLLPNEYMFIFTILLTVFQLVSPYFLLFGGRFTRYSSVFLSELFHIYTSMIPVVSYSFIIITLPFLYLLFIHGYRFPNLRKFGLQWMGYLAILLFSFLSLVRLAIPGNDYFTSEGSKYALNMFAYRYSCKISWQDRNLENIDGLGRFTNQSFLYTRFSGYLCSPWETLYMIWPECIDDRPRSLKMVLFNKHFSHTVVDVENYCAIGYKPFIHNYWIKDADYKDVFNKETLSDSAKWLFERQTTFFHLYYLLFYVISFSILMKLFSKINS